MEARLIVLQGANSGREIPLPHSQFIIGRNASCHLRPHSELVSKVHCAIVCQPHRVIVRDLRSRNGTFVNDEAVHGTRMIHDGDVLRVACLAFRFAVGDTKVALTADGIRWLVDEAQNHQQVAELETQIALPADMQSPVNGDAALSAGGYLREFLVERGGRSR